MMVTKEWLQDRYPELRNEDVWRQWLDNHPELKMYEPLYMWSWSYNDTAAAE